jgi:hypothetical protein
MIVSDGQQRAGGVSTWVGEEDIGLHFVSVSVEASNGNDRVDAKRREDGDRRDTVNSRLGGVANFIHD